MIQNKEDLKFYLSEDKKRLAKPITWRDRFFYQEKYYIWRFIVNLRKLEYRQNTNTNKWRNLLYLIQFRRFCRWQHKTQLYIFPNVCGPGLFIPHLGYLLISAQGEIGKNCTIRPGTLIASNLGSSNTKLRKVIVGDNVEFSAGCKILCKKIGNNVSVGPNAVVSKNVPDNSIVMGNPAEIIPKIM